jgi:uncharacterized membrane protein
MANDLQNQINQNTFTQNPPPQPTFPTQPQFLNPHNFEKVLGKENVILPPQNPNTPLVVQPQGQIQTQQDESPPIKIESMPLTDYDALKKVSNIERRNSHDVLKLVIYAVPIIAIFFQLLKPVEENDVKYATKQSLVGQGLWFLVLIFLRILDAPIISDQGAVIWNIVCYGALLIAGIQAYNGTNFKIPVAYDLGKGFIEDY